MYFFVLWKYEQGVKKRGKHFVEYNKMINRIRHISACRPTDMHNHYHYNKNLNAVYSAQVKVRGTKLLLSFILLLTPKIKSGAQAGILILCTSDQIYMYACKSVCFYFPIYYYTRLNSFF